MANTNNASATAYKNTYTTFSGCDVVASFGASIIGELQGISYSVTREKAPVYTMGSADPRSFSRGKRGIAGTLVFAQFDSDALLRELQYTTGGIHRVGAGITNTTEGTERSAINPIEEWDSKMTGVITSGESSAARTRAITNETLPAIADEIMPFDITISLANEYGKAAVLVLYGVEILNEGMQMSIDTIQTQKACTFVARRIKSMTAVKL